ncbi:MAG: hypothetical protein AAGC66_00285 [Leifsonia sp.]
MIVHRLTVAGRDFFIADPIERLQQQILDAVRAGGGYVRIPQDPTGPGTQILFSPGTPVTWTDIHISDTPEPAESFEHEMLDPFDF